MSDLWAYNPDVCDGEEVWKPVVGYEGLYEVSSMGRVRRKQWLLMHPKEEKCGYRRVLLTKDGEQKPFLVHRLVAEAFIPNPNNYPIINHMDECPSNNRVGNLEWCTYKHNANWGTNPQRHSENSHNKRGVVAIDIATGERTYYGSIRAASIAMTRGASGGSSISEAASGKRKSAYGKCWYYCVSSGDGMDGR